MSAIEVVYENGVFRPLQPIELPEGAIGQVLIAPTPAQEVEGPVEETNESPGERAYRLLMELAALPHTQSDGLTDISTRHDEILYPKNGKMP